MSLHNLLKLLEYKVLLDRAQKYLEILCKSLREGWVIPARQNQVYRKIYTKLTQLTDLTCMALNLL